MYEINPEAISFSVVNKFSFNWRRCTSDCQTSLNLLRNSDRFLFIDPPPIAFFFSHSVHSFFICVSLKKPKPL